MDPVSFTTQISIVSTLFRHFIEQVRNQTGSVYGRCLYEVMRYWDDDHTEWDAEERDFATAWRSQPKWVVSRSLTSVGPNATLVEGDLEAAMRALFRATNWLAGNDIKRATLSGVVAAMGLNPDDINCCPVDCCAWLEVPKTSGK
jgi:hypothetical protein